MAEFWTSWNSLYPRCVDCRAAGVYVEWRDGAWQVLIGQEILPEVQGLAEEEAAHFRGGGLDEGIRLQPFTGKVDQDFFRSRSNQVRSTGLRAPFSGRGSRECGTSNGG